MANGRRRSIYSTRQRMAPGQYETPLADFLDQLPEYFNQYQQNQIALEKQKLQERRYENELEYRKARNKIVDDRYNDTIIRNERIREEKEESDNDKLLFGVGKALIEKGKYTEALPYFKGKPEIEESLKAIGKKQDTMNSSLRNLSDRIADPDVSPHEKRIKIDEFKSEYKNDYTLGSSIDTFLNRVDKQVSAEVDRNNAGSWNIEEWETRFGLDGRNDANAIKEAEEQIESLREKFLETPLVKKELGGDEGIAKAITDQKIKIKSIYDKPRYRLETEDEYKQRIRLEKAGVKDFGSQSGAIPITMPSIATGTATFPDAGQQLSSEQLAEFESNIDKTMSDLISDPVVTEESVVEGGKTNVNLPGFVSGVKAGTPPPVKTETNQEVEVEPKPLGTNISTDIKKPKGRYGNAEGALSETYKKIKKIEKLEDRSSYTETKGGQQSYENSLKQADKLRAQLKKDILSIYDPSTRQFRYPGYAEMFSTVGDKVMSFGKEKQLDTRNIAGGLFGRQRVPVSNIMSFIEGLFPPQVAVR